MYVSPIAVQLLTGASLEKSATEGVSVAAEAEPVEVDGKEEAGAAVNSALQSCFKLLR